MNEYNRLIENFSDFSSSDEIDEAQTSIRKSRRKMKTVAHENENFHFQERNQQTNQTSHSLIWQDLSIANTKNSTQIVKRCSGIVKSGELLAIMGSSGAGKTTLLNCLANRNVSASLTTKGSIRLIEENFSVSDLSNSSNFNSNSNSIHNPNISAYCQQNDVFLENLTVYEHLYFHAKLRGLVNEKARIRQILTEMKLEKCANTKIGSGSGQFKTLSGGEKKRLSFASKILIQPKILFCDEPTSGLDSHLAYSVVKCLKKIAEKSTDHKKPTRTSILCTIHQPNSDTFQMFDKVLLLSQGYTVYFGEAKKFVLDYFLNTLNLRCPANYNPADFIIKFSAKNEIKSSRLSEKFYQSKEFQSNFSEECAKIISNSNTCTFDKNVSNECKGEMVLFDQDLVSGPGTGLDFDAGVRPETSTRSTSPKKVSKITILCLLLWRSILTNYRDPKLFLTRIAQTVAIGVLLSCIYLPSSKNGDDIDRYIGLEATFSSKNTNNNQTISIKEYTDIRRINGAIFATTATASFNFLFYVLLIFPVLMPVWRMEYQDHLYPITLAFLATNLAELPILMILPLIFSVICYNLIGLVKNFNNFYTFFKTILLMSNTAASFGYFGSALSDNPRLVTELVPALMLPLICFGGFVTPIESIPEQVRWIKGFSWFPHSTEILMVNQWEGVRFDCLVRNGTNGDDFVRYGIEFYFLSFFFVSIFFFYFPLHANFSNHKNSLFYYMCVSTISTSQSLKLYFPA